MTLDELRIGQNAVVRKMNGAGAQKVRMMDMGISKGVRLELRNIAPLGDPIEISIMGYELSLRKEDCKMVEVEVIEEVTAYE